jgi:hypothetical protein
MSKLKLGNVYTSRYGQSRVPVREDGGYVIYIDYNTQIFGRERVPMYNPYKNYTKITSFNLNYKETDEVYIKQKDLTKVQEILNEADEKWKELIANPAIKIYNLCQSKQ